MTDYDRFVRTMQATNVAVFWGFMSPEEARRRVMEAGEELDPEAR